jgi:hypothetical protein
MSNGYQSPIDQPGRIIGGRERGQAARLTESWREADLFARESQKASSARAIEDERKLWWSVGLGLLGSLFGPIGTVIGAGVGKVVGEMGTVGGEQAETYLVSTDVGKYDKQKKLQLEDFNKTLSDYDRGQLWTDIMDIGKTALFSYKQSAGSLSEFDPFSWGGKGGDLAPGAEFLEDAWKRLFPDR